MEKTRENASAIWASGGEGDETRSKRRRRRRRQNNSSSTIPTQQQHSMTLAQQATQPTKKKNVPSISTAAAFLDGGGSSSQSISSHLPAFAHCHPSICGHHSFPAGLALVLPVLTQNPKTHPTPKKYDSETGYGEK